MSVAAVVVNDNFIIIGADTQVTLTEDGHKREYDKAKIGRFNDFIFAGAGSAYEISLLDMYINIGHVPIDNTCINILNFVLEFSKWKKKKLEQEMVALDCSYLMVYKDKAFEVTTDFGVTEITNYAAIGSGRIHAETALYLKHTLDDALKATCRLSAYCEEPLIIYYVSRENHAKDI